MPFEVHEATADSVNSPKGSFTPRADQKKYRSAFPCIGGNKASGFDDAHTLQGGVFTKDGRASITFRPYSDEKGKPHRIRVNGMECEEWIAEIEECQKKEKYDAELSNADVRIHTQKGGVAATPETIGRQVIESTTALLVNKSQ